MTKPRDGIHQIHCDIPQTLYNELKIILHEKGMISTVIRVLLWKYIYLHSKNQHNVIDRVVEDAVNRCKHCGGKYEIRKENKDGRAK